MITFKGFLAEARGTSLSDLLFLPRIGWYDQLMIPISSSMFKRIWPDTLRATVFHTTDGEGIKNIAKLQGKKKQISAFFSMQARYMKSGVATEGGIHSVLEMEADVLLSASGDIMSHIDRSGRRWTSISDLKETSRGVKFGGVEKDLEKMFEALVEKYLDKGEFQQSATSFQLWSMAKRKVDSKTMRLIIKDYLDGMETVIKKNIGIFSEVMLGYAKKRTTNLSWDEQVVNNIKVTKVHLINNRGKDWFEAIKTQSEKLFGSIKIWKSPEELETYTREIAKKELGK